MLSVVRGACRKRRNPARSIKTRCAHLPREIKLLVPLTPHLRAQPLNLCEFPMTSTLWRCTRQSRVVNA
jgi:hypothetical protein